MIDTTKLRELAQKATPSEWIRDDVSGIDCDVRAKTPNGKGRKIALCWGIGGSNPYSKEYKAVCDANANFIASANPAALLELLDRLEAAEKDAKRYRVLRDSKYQLSEDDICVSDSFFTQYFDSDLDAAVDELAGKYAAMQQEAGG